MSSVPPSHAVVGRYLLCDPIAVGGMATVHFGRLVGSVGFSRTVAIKRLHPQFATEPELAAMFLDEARLVARVRHPNVVPTVDVVAQGGELFLVMEYVHGESLSALLRESPRIPAPIAATILAGVLQGLHAAHEAASETGEALGIVHRDVSPKNILVGADGVARVVDFGVAKAIGRLSLTRDGRIKGTIAYMAPEQIRGHAVTRRTDVYAASVVLWQAITGQRLFHAEDEMELMVQVLERPVAAPSSIARNIPPSLDAVVLRGLERDPANRFATAHDMAVALERATPLASQREIGEWVRELVGEQLAERAERLKGIETSSVSISMPPATGGAPVPRLLGADALSDPAESPTDVAVTSLMPVRRTARRSHATLAIALGLIALGATALAITRLRTTPLKSAQADAAVTLPEAETASTVVDPTPIPSVATTGIDRHEQASLVPSATPDASKTAASARAPAKPAASASAQPKTEADPKRRLYVRE